MKVNKKLMIPVLGILVIGMVFAVLVASNVIRQDTFNAENPIVSSGTSTDDLGNVYGGEAIVGDGFTLQNDGLSGMAINLFNDAPNGVDVIYTGTLDLTTKDTTTWISTNTASATIEYTIIGEDFEVSGIPTGYTLVYYPDTELGFANNVANVIVLNEGSNDISDLPLDIDIGDDYCNNGFNPGTTTCGGAKLWLIPGDETQALADLGAWTNTENYMFETKLIQYSSLGNVNLYNGMSLEFTPEYTIDINYQGSTIITTEVTNLNLI